LRKIAKRTLRSVNFALPFTASGIVPAFQETQICGMTAFKDLLPRLQTMKVADILQIKGSDVKTVRPDTSARELAVRLHVEQIGAMVVSSDGRSVDGLASERDLAYALAAHGSELPKLPVSRLMTKAVVVCSPEDSIIHVIKLMTQRRIRHLPVKEGDQLVGIISIGDVLKHRLDELELEANVMRDYAVAARR
jgi:CBS domain-containing protein